jgi:hypothetical protein
MSLGKAPLPAILLLLALLPTASATDGSAGAPASAGSAPSAACLAAGASPPCGYIVPQLALDFPDKPTCKAETLGGPVDLSKCMPLPANGGSVQQKGVLRWYWDMTQDGTYPIDPTDPIVIQFSGTATNPQYLELKVEPASFTLDAAAMASPENLKPDAGANKVWFWYEKPITVTITRTADPNGQDLAKVSNAGGVQKVFLKAKSNASGAYFKEAFGVEEFRFNAYQDPAIQSAATGGASKDSPAAGVLPVLGVLGLALALVAFRRR